MDDEKQPTKIFMISSSFKWLFTFSLCLILGALVFAPTLFIPFYVSDDADTYRVANQVLSSIRDGDLIQTFRMDASSRRNFPGFFYYQALRVFLFGKASVAWHLWQLMIYTTIGLLATYFGWRITQSYIPGISAYILLITTGEAVPKSNWDNLINLVTFEPPLMLLWMASAYFLLAGSQSRGKATAWFYLTIGFLLLIWSVVYKETSFLIVGAVALIVLIILAWRWKVGELKTTIGPIAAPLIGALIIAAAWGVVVYFRLPKDDSYGGMNSLDTSLNSLWETFKSYRGILVGQSDYLIPLGLGILLVRLLGLRFNRVRLSGYDYWQLILLFAGFCQLLTLLIWPYTEGRYVQPAYLCFLLVCMNEFVFLIKRLWRPGEENLRFPLTWVVAVLLFLVFFLLSFLLKVDSFVSVLKWSLLAISWVSAGLIYLNFGQLLTVIVARVSLASTLLLCLFIVGVQSLNVRSYILWDYAVTEGMRYQIVNYIKAAAPRNAAVFWIVDNGNDGHAWASAMYLSQFMNREDLLVGPAEWVYSQRKIKQGDLLIPYLNNVHLPAMGQGTLQQVDLVSGGSTSNFTNTADVRTYITRMLFYPSTTSIEEIQLVSKYLRVPVYQVLSPSWTPYEVPQQRYF